MNDMHIRYQATRPGLPQDHRTLRNVTVVPSVNDRAVIGIVVLDNKADPFTERHKHRSSSPVAYLFPLLKSRLNKRFAEKRIKKNLEGKKILLKETHHGIKNNLRIISSFPGLQCAGLCSLGLRLVSVLPEQAGGTLSISGDVGTTVSPCFPYPSP